MASSFLGKIPTFVEHLLVATVPDSMNVEIVNDLLLQLTTAMTLPGVLATHVGLGVPVCGDHSFVMHIRAVDTASCDAAYKAAYEACLCYCSLHNVKHELSDMHIVDYESQPVGSWREKWPALRVALLKFRPDTPKARITRLEEVINNLPSMFPLVKQITWGRNIAKERMYRGNYEYADVDQEFGALLGFSSCKDMHMLGDDPKYWELLNFHGITFLDKYQVLTLCLV